MHISPAEGRPSWVVLQPHWRLQLRVFLQPMSVQTMIDAPRPFSSHPIVCRPDSVKHCVLPWISLMAGMT